MARQLARRQQRERIAGVVVVCLGLVVLVVAVLALREPNGHVAAGGGSSSNAAEHSPSGPMSSDSSVTESTPQRSDSPSADTLKAVPLVVLNNSFIHGLAAQASQQFENGGWTVRTFGNYQNDIISTCAYYDRSDPTAKAAAQALRQQFPAIKRVKPKFADLPAGRVVVVLTGDYAST